MYRATWTCMVFLHVVHPLHYHIYGYSYIFGTLFISFLDWFVNTIWGQYLRFGLVEADHKHWQWTENIQCHSHVRFSRPSGASLDHYWSTKYIYYIYIFFSFPFHNYILVYVLGSCNPLCNNWKYTPNTHTHDRDFGICIFTWSQSITSLCISDRVECYFLLQFLQAAINATSTKGEMVSMFGLLLLKALGGLGMRLVKRRLDWLDTKSHLPHSCE